MPHVIQDTRRQFRVPLPRRRLIGLLAVVLWLVFPVAGAAQDHNDAWPTIETKTDGMEKLTGFFRSTGTTGPGHCGWKSADLARRCST